MCAEVIRYVKYCTAYVDYGTILLRLLLLLATKLT
jgi:hypothetical protein